MKTDWPDSQSLMMVTLLGIVSNFGKNDYRRIDEMKCAPQPTIHSTAEACNFHPHLFFQLHTTTLPRRHFTLTHFALHPPAFITSLRLRLSRIKHNC